MLTVFYTEYNTDYLEPETHTATFASECEALEFIDQHDLIDADMYYN